MADKRYYAKIDVGYLGNPKIAPLLELHPRAVLLHSWGVLYSKQHGTDGVIPFRLGMRELWIDRCSEHCGEQCNPQCDLGMLLQSMLFERIDATRMLVHDYLEHQDSSETIKRASDKGRRAAEARWNKPKSDARSNASGNASSNASGNAKERRGEESNAAFENWWLHYPKKVSKADARRAYLKAIKTTDAETLIAGADRYAAQVKGTEQRFIANGATWLNSERWLDEAPPTTQRGGRVSHVNRDGTHTEEDVWE